MQQSASGNDAHSFHQLQQLAVLISVSPGQSKQTLVRPAVSQNDPGKPTDISDSIKADPWLGQGETFSENSPVSRTLQVL